jgi:hypothetical protein
VNGTTTPLDTIAASDRHYTAACSCGWQAPCATRPGALVLAEHHLAHTTGLEHRVHVRGAEQ